MITTDVIPIHLRVDPRDIGLLKFVIESYEGVAIVRTVDRRAAIVVLLVVPDSLDHARSILASVAALAPWQEVAAPAESDDWLLGGEE